MQYIHFIVFACKYTTFLWNFQTIHKEILQKTVTLKSLSTIKSLFEHHKAAGNGLATAVGAEVFADFHLIV